MLRCLVPEPAVRFGVCIGFLSCFSHQKNERVVSKALEQSNPKNGKYEKIELPLPH